MDDDIIKRYKEEMKMYREMVREHIAKIFEDAKRRAKHIVEDSRRRTEIEVRRAREDAYKKVLNAMRNLLSELEGARPTARYVPAPQAYIPPPPDGVKLIIILLFLLFLLAILKAIE